MPVLPPPWSLPQALCDLQYPDVPHSVLRSVLQYQAAECVGAVRVLFKTVSAR